MPARAPVEPVLVEHYSSEQEQIERLKRWWRDNGKALILGLVVGIGGLAGYRYWEGAQTARAEGASITYELVLQLLEDGRLDDVEKTGQTLLEKYPDTPYARMTALLLAKIAVDRPISTRRATCCCRWRMATVRLPMWRGCVSRGSRSGPTILRRGPPRAGRTARRR